MRGPKLEESYVIDIRRRSASGEPYSVLAEDFNCDISTISNIVTGKRHANVDGGINVRPARSPNKLTEDEVREIRVRLRDGEAQRVLAADYGVRAATISGINRGLSWKNKGLIDG